MFKFLIEAISLLLGVGMVLGIVYWFVDALVYVTPALRRVRFADRTIRTATPMRLRWLGIAKGRRVRTRSRQRRAGSRLTDVKLLGVGLLVPATPVIAVTMMALALNRARPDTESVWLDIARTFVGPAAAVYVMPKLWRAFRRLSRERRRLRAATAADVRATDSRAPIVLLRAFRDDGQPVALREDGGLPMTLEEVLVERLARHGPVIAVGSPGEPLPPIGAGREYVSGDWQARVAQLIDEAGVIVVLLDRTAGLLWEIEQVLTRRRETRLIIIVPDRAIEELDARWQSARQTIVNCRPELENDGLSIVLRNTLAVVFDGDHRAQRICARGRSRPYYRDAVDHAMWFVGTK